MGKIGKSDERLPSSPQREGIGPRSRGSREIGVLRVQQLREGHPVFLLASCVMLEDAPPETWMMIDHVLETVKSHLKEHGRTPTDNKGPVPLLVAHAFRCRRGPGSDSLRFM